MERDEVEAGIRAAFAGVRLGSGMSLRQSSAPDRLGPDLTMTQFERLPDSEVTDDWERVPEDEFRTAQTAYLDPEGLRYYLPAMLLYLLRHCDDEEEWHLDPDLGVTMTVALGWIAPGKESRADHYALLDRILSPRQRAAVAAYVEALPGLVELGYADARLVERSIRDYWGAFAPVN